MILRVFQVNESSIDFWNNIKLTWQQCADLPVRCYASSVAELDGKVYIAVACNKDYYFVPLMYDSHMDKWSILPELPHVRFSLVAVPYKKQLLAIGGVSNTGVYNKVFAWDENNKKWTTPYYGMPTARYDCCSISHGSAVIVVGGVICPNPYTLTGAVEVLHFGSWFSKPYWSEVKQLPYVVHEALPFIIDDNLYIAEGFDDNGESTCNIVTASLPELLQSKARSGEIWNRLPDMPYSPWSITHYQGHLIIFNGDRKIEQSRNWELVQMSYLYNPNTKSWDCVGDDFHDYKLGKAVHLGENKIFFVGGLTGTFSAARNDDMVKTCSMLTITPK